MSGTSPYSGRLRVRSCGILIRDEKLLLLKLKSPVSGNYIWMPPGGGVELGESLKETVAREFKEETGLEVNVQTLVHINELIQAPFHVIEFYFAVEETGGELKLGTDPEHPKDQQLIKELAFFSWDELQLMDVEPVFFKSSEFWN